MEDTYKAARSCILEALDKVDAMLQTSGKSVDTCSVHVSSSSAKNTWVNRDSGITVRGLNEKKNQSQERGSKVHWKNVFGKKQDDEKRQKEKHVTRMFCCLHNLTFTLYRFTLYRFIMKALAHFLLLVGRNKTVHTRCRNRHRWMVHLSSEFKT